MLCKSNAHLRNEAKTFKIESDDPKNDCWSGWIFLKILFFDILELQHLHNICYSQAALLFRSLLVSVTPEDFRPNWGKSYFKGSYDSPIVPRVSQFQNCLEKTFRAKHTDDPPPITNCLSQNTFLRSGTKWREYVDHVKTQTGRNVCRDSLVTHYLLSCHAAVHLLLRRDTSHLLGEEGTEGGVLLWEWKVQGVLLSFPCFPWKTPTPPPLPWSVSLALSPSLSPNSLVVPNVFPVQGKDLFPHRRTSHRHTPGKHTLLAADLQYLLL